MIREFLNHNKGNSFLKIKKTQPAARSYSCFALAIVALLAKVLVPDTARSVAKIGAPKFLAGVIIAAVVLQELFYV